MAKLLFLMAPGMMIEPAPGLDHELCASISFLLLLTGLHHTPTFFTVTIILFLMKI